MTEFGIAATVLKAPRRGMYHDGWTRMCRFGSPRKLPAITESSPASTPSKLGPRVRRSPGECKSGAWFRPLPAVYLVSRITRDVASSSMRGRIRVRTRSDQRATPPPLILWDLAQAAQSHRSDYSPTLAAPRDTSSTARPISSLATSPKSMASPCSSVARCLVDIGVPWGEGIAARCLDEAVRRESDQREGGGHRHSTGWPARGRNGVGPMRAVLSDRLGWSSLTESQLEDEYLRIMRARA